MVSVGLLRALRPIVYELTCKQVALQQQRTQVARPTPVSLLQNAQLVLGAEAPPFRAHHDFGVWLRRGGHRIQQTITDTDITSLQEFAAQVQSSLNGPDIDKDFEAQRSIIDLLDVQARLIIEDGQRMAYVYRKIGEQPLCIYDNRTRACASSAAFRIRSASR